jgi:hypothetical protein
MAAFGGRRRASRCLASASRKTEGAVATAITKGVEVRGAGVVGEEPVLKPGEKAWFKSRLASPPPEGRNIDVRFFSKRDIAAGNV